MNNTVSPPLAYGRHPRDVLSVTELLENVLCDLSPGDILKNSQAVSKFWRDCVQGSTALAWQHPSKQARWRNLEEVDAHIQKTEGTYRGDGGPARERQMVVPLKAICLVC